MKEEQRLECEKLKAEIQALGNPPRRSKLDSLEKIFKMAAAVLIPLVVGFVG